MPKVGSEQVAMSTASDSITRTDCIQVIVLALIAGYVDSFTLINFQVFASFMSGNTTESGLHAGQGMLASAAYRLLPVPLFVIGVAISTLLLAGPRPWRICRLWGIVAALLAASATVMLLRPPGGWLCVVLLSFAMGVLNASMTQVGGQTVGLGYVTGDLYNLGRCLGLVVRGDPTLEGQTAWDAYGWRVAILTSVWTAFLLGAVLGGVGILMAGKWVLMAPLAALFMLMVHDRNLSARH